MVDLRLIDFRPGNLLHPVQRAAGRALRARVAGDDAPVAAQRIWGAQGERWFTPSDPVWRVQAEAAMFPGGVAALLLQSLHPSAMAGVAGHSGYKSDPWGRLQRTSHFLATTTFGTIADAEAAIEQVRRIHERVRGRDDQGVPYRASDPNLLAWVHTAEAYSFLTAHQLFARQPLTAEEADRYVEQSAIVAQRLGADPVPRSVAELHRLLDDYRPQLRATAAAQETARFLLLNPPLPVPARPAYAAIAAGGLHVLPDWARQALKIPYPVGRTWVSRTAGRFAAGSIRWAMAGLDDDAA